MFETLPLPAQAFLQILFVFAFAPLLIGIMRKVKARLQGRSGGPIFQPYIDILKLLSKGTAKSSISSFIYVIAPVVGFVSVAIAALSLPILSPVPFLVINIIIFAYLFSIGRFLTALSGLDAGSSFGGLGSSREMLYSVLIEPALFAVILFIVSSGSFNTIMPVASGASISFLSILLSPAIWLAALGLFVIVLAETGRLPFDNPATHLELTMVHEAMILENSGPDLALIEWAHAAKIFLLFSLIAVLFVPILPQGDVLRLGFVLGISIVLSVLTAVVESISVKVRLFKIGELLILALLLAVLSFLTTIFGANLGADLFTATLVFIMLLGSLYFIFSATFNRRIELYALQSLCLALIFLQQAIISGTFDGYFRLGATVLFKVIIMPLLFYQLFRLMPGEIKLLPIQFYNVFRSTKEDLRLKLDFDPLFMGSQILPARALMYCGMLIVLAFALSSIFGSTNILLPLALSLILIGMLIIAVKAHLLLQLMGFLLMENGVVLLPTALPIHLPFVGDALALFDVVVLIIVAVLLALKIRATVGTMDTKNLDDLIEKIQ
ncbi:NADH-quinone oxidoreductase subunit H [Candidatus Micrarchaeota archaeon]|nr:NADH-quinone oxidoreductase subunit H [Candidatus Micrarchaeota archaeon]